MTKSGAPVAPLRDGATVMLVRDGVHPVEPLEVFMLRRHPSTAFGSVHVFPGGVVDDADGDARIDDRCGGFTDADASRLLGVPSGGRAFWVAAVREAFEEAGVLLAHRVHGEPLRFDDPAEHERFDDHRSALLADRRTLLDVLEAEDLSLSLPEVRYVARWITPESEPKRYDTRFFVARAPEGHAYVHADGELIASEWVRPADALARHRAGDFAMIGPTIESLRDLSRFPTVDQLWTEHGIASSLTASPGGPHG